MDNNIVELEKKYWNAMAIHDYETLKELTKFPCIVAGKQGVMTVNEAAFKKMFDQGGSKKVKVKVISETQVETEDNFGLIAYLIELDYDGQSMKCACTSTWIKVDNKWLCAMHTESDMQKSTTGTV